MRFFTGLLAAGAAALGVAQAQTVDQEQPLFDTSLPTLAIGGSSESKLAQTFTVGMSGDLTAVELPVACSGGQLYVEIQGVSPSGQPSGAVLVRAVVPGTDLPAPPVDFERIYLPSDVSVSSGDHLAIVLINTSGTCAVAQAPAGDTYIGGELFFDARPNPPGWISNKEFYPGEDDVPLDLAFRTLMADGGGGGMADNRCTVITNDGPQTLPIPDSLPICRCLEDAGARELRCRLMHPDFFMARYIPLPFDPGTPFEEEWLFTPLTDLKAPVEVEFMGAGLDKPVRHVFGKKSKVGSFERFVIKGMTPKMKDGLPGAATFFYEGIGPNDPDSLGKFEFDRSLPPAALEEWPELMKEKP